MGWLQMRRDPLWRGGLGLRKEGYHKQPLDAEQGAGACPIIVFIVSALAALVNGKKVLVFWL